MKVNECITNNDCLTFLFKNDRYFQKILSSWKMAAQYIHENKRYAFYYKSLTAPVSIQFFNKHFENMVRRPPIYLEDKHYCCEPHQVSIEKKQYSLDNAEQDYLKNYGMGYYYVNRIIRAIETLKNNIQTSQNSECPIKLSNPDCIIGDMSVYKKIRANLNISERGNIMITIPKIYFPNLKDDEIRKTYNIYDILQLYRLHLNR
jgi:hypothetical protein